jgi:hypothetical protein
MLLSGLMTSILVFFAVSVWGGGRALLAVILAVAAGVGMGIYGLSKSAFPFYLAWPFAVGVGVTISALLTAFICAIFEKRISAAFGRRSASDS